MSDICHIFIELPLLSYNRVFINFFIMRLRHSQKRNSRAGWYIYIYIIYIRQVVKFNNSTLTTYIVLLMYSGFIIWVYEGLMLALTPQCCILATQYLLSSMLVLRSFVMERRPPQREVAAWLILRVARNHDRFDHIQNSLG